MAQPEESFLRKWLAENNSFQSWLIQNKYVLAEFDERPMLVEEIRDVVFNSDGDALVTRRMKEEDVMTLKPARAEQPDKPKKEKILVLRDYDQKDVSLILDKPSTLEILKSRVKRDPKTVEKLKKRIKSEEKKGIRPLVTTEDALRYRIDWDTTRWGLREDTKERKTDPSSEASGE
jgi:hypothetical protein